MTATRAAALDTPKASSRPVVGKLDDQTRFFFNLLLIATIFPIFFVPFAAPLRPQVASIDGVFDLLFLLSTMHVGLTAFFYSDKTYRSVAMEKWGYYFAFPAAVIVLLGAIAMAFPTSGIIYIMIFYHAWLLFHYGRQNYGILAFVATATQTGRPSVFEKTALHLAPIGGILAAYSVLPQAQDSVISNYIKFLFDVGAVLTIAAILCGLIGAVVSFRSHGNLRRPIMLLILSCFYVPTFFFLNYTQAILGYAIAHAIQYFVFMTFLAAGTQKRPPIVSLFVLLFWMLGVWIVILITREESLFGDYQNFVGGAAVGLIIWHFVMDAGFWKLSVPWQRNQVRQRLGFLFK